MKSAETKTKLYWWGSRVSIILGVLVMLFVGSFSGSFSGSFRAPTPVPVTCTAGDTECECECECECSCYPGSTTATEVPGARLVETNLMIVGSNKDSAKVLCDLNGGVTNEWICPQYHGDCTMRCTITKEPSL